MKYIFEKVYIETPVDTDEDGKLDLIAAFIRRPSYISGGKRVPAVFVANPYMMTCNEDWYVPHDVDREVETFDTQNINKDDVSFDFSAQTQDAAGDRITFQRVTNGFVESNPVNDDYEFECISDLYAHLNDRGYATVFSGGLGTLDSEGLTIPGSRQEIMAFKSVIDWLNGRCRAFTDKTSNIEIKATWCTGNVAMSAKSYLGTMCIGVAATGVDGLKTIIPEAGICNWYNYYRYNGLNLPAMGWQGDDLDILSKYCFSRAKDPEDYAGIKAKYEAVFAALVEGEDRHSGNYNRFWDERNYLNQIDNIKASVFIIHGINDWNVKTNQCFDLFEALQEHGIERKILLHQGEHIYVYNLIGSKTMEYIDDWLDHYLLGVNNGIENGAKVVVESNLDQRKWIESDIWPPEGIKLVDFPIDEIETGSGAIKSGLALIRDDINGTCYDRAKDNLIEWRDELVMKYDNPGRLKCEWDPFEGNDYNKIRLAGRVGIAFDAAIDKPTAIMSAMLVDVGEDFRLTSVPTPNTDEPFEFKLDEIPSQYKVITRGWMNAQNRESICSKIKIKPGEMNSYSFEMIPTDHTLKRGHKLALIIYGIDAEATQRPDTITEISIDVATINCSVPLQLA